MNEKSKKILIIFIAILFIGTIFTTVIFSDKLNEENNKEKTEKIIFEDGIKKITKTYNFSEPNFIKQNNLVVVNILEANHQSMGDGRPVLPYNLTTLKFPFGTKIIDINFEYSTPKKITISDKISYASCSTLTEDDEKIYKSSEMYPNDYVTYHKGGGLDIDELKTFLNIRVNPIVYFPLDHKLNFTNKVKVDIIYKEPEESLFTNNSEFDFLIISPEKFVKHINKLVNHKQDQNINTKLVTVKEITNEYKGYDDAEKIKFYIKDSIEQYSIKSVLLIGGIDRQFDRWNTPPRYSHVEIREGTQEFVVPSFINDLYFADIYDSEGNFSSWDTNNNHKYAEYKNKTIDKMDLYPDVRLGRLPCRNSREAKIIVDKIINYENQNADDWFKNLILVSGDHWADENQISEGVLIMEKAAELMNDFKPVELYATKENTLLIKDINNAMNKGAGFAYFCGHGSPTAWGIHYPPDATGWAPSILGIKSATFSFYRPFYMKFLKNKYKLPVTIVGGCNNGQFDISIMNKLKNGKIKFTTGCWAWKLTSQKNGGAIATIANTNLGTHAMDDSDFNGVNDYLEAYDGWLELKFLELYNKENINNLGILHQKAITDYLHMFLGNNDEMDIKMAQQWELFGDPSLMIKEI